MSPFYYALVALTVGLGDPIIMTSEGDEDTGLLPSWMTLISKPILHAPYHHKLYKKRGHFAFEFLYRACDDIKNLANFRIRYGRASAKQRRGFT